MAYTPSYYHIYLIFFKALKRGGSPPLGGFDRPEKSTFIYN